METALDVTNFILTRFATVDEALTGLREVRVVPVLEDAMGIPVYTHWMVTGPEDKSVVIEFKDSGSRDHALEGGRRQRV